MSCSVVGKIIGGKGTKESSEVFDVFARRKVCHDIKWARHVVDQEETGIACIQTDR